MAIGMMAGLATATTWPVVAAGSTDSIASQDGWSGGTIQISASIDQAIDQSGLNRRTGRGAWRISNNTSLGNYNGPFSGWVFAPGLPVSAGHPSSGAGADRFRATLWFRAASATADGSNIEIDLGNVDGNDRNTFLALTNRANADGGLQLRAGEPDGATGDFRKTAIIATHITRGDWHRLDIVANFHDGPTNDTVEYTLDGVVVDNPAGGTTFGTFEGYREGIGSPYTLTNRLYFRSGAKPSSYGTFDDTAAQGFYFDDMTYSVARQSAPRTPLAVYEATFDPIRTFSGGSDFDGDGKADIAVLRPSPGNNVFVLSSGTRVGTAAQLALGGDVPVPGDYDGDGKADVAAFRPSNGTWLFADAGSGMYATVSWGRAGDIPVPGDYNGDGKTDVAVFRPSEGTWSVRGLGIVYWGVATDKPVPADYDGDGRTDIAVFRPETGAWFIRQSSTGDIMTKWWGKNGDVLLPADYDGDGKADITVFEPESGVWWVFSSRTGEAWWALYGNATDTPVPADYDGDGTTDVAIYRPSDGTWYIYQSSTGLQTIDWWGTASDIAIQ